MFARRLILSMVAGAPFLCGVAAIKAADSRPARDLGAELPRIPPRTPQESLRMIHLIPGFKAELVAAEPVVFSPVAIDFDENGRVYVCEMVDYPFWEDEAMGNVVVLEDTDGDGVLDKRTVLIEKLHWPTAVLCFDGGCFAASAPDLYYFKDTDGDGKADVRKKLFTGFGTQNVQGLINSFRWGIDCRVHGATGTNGGSITRADLPGDPKTNKPVNLSGRDFSFDPRRLDLRPESGGAQHGMCFDDFGRKFVSSNSDHIQQVVYDDGYAGLSPIVQMPPARVSIAADGPQAAVFRVSPVEPWRIVRTRMRVSGESKGLIEGGGQPAGYFTGATGVTIYRGDAFPSNFNGNAFVGDVGSNLVHRKILQPTDGVLMRAERAEQGGEFLASEDIWFRPAQFANAPDGTLWILDVCREVIEHPASLPDEIKKHLDLTSGRDRGRIYRVVPVLYRERPRPHMGTKSADDLLDLLNSPNGWRRDTAQRLLYERGEPKDLETLQDATWRANTLGALAGAFLLKSRQDPGLQLADDADGATNLSSLRFADQLRVAEPGGARSESLLRRPPPDTGAPEDAETALQKALAWAATPGRKEGRDLARESAVAALLGGPFGNDAYIRRAALSAIRSDCDRVIEELLRHWTPAEPGYARQGVVPAVWSEIGRLAARLATEAELQRVGELARSDAADRYPDAMEQLVAGLLIGFADRGADGARLRRSASNPAFEKLADDTLKHAATVVTMKDEPVEARLDAIRLLAVDEPARSREALKRCVKADQPPEIQRAAAAALAGHDSKDAWDLLVRLWPTLTPATRSVTVDAMLSRPESAVYLLSKVEAGELPSAAIDATRLARLQKSKSAELVKLANALAAKTKVSPRAAVVADYRKSLQLRGNAETGKTLFAQTCATCHRVADVGIEIGPNLATMKTRGAEAILANILDPNREVNGQYVEYVVDTKDGQTVSGLLANESSATITLLKPGGEKQSLARDQIESLRGTGMSLMPEGLERQLDPQAMADLIAFLLR